MAGRLNQATASTLGLSPAESVAIAPGPATVLGAAPVPSAERLGPTVVRNVQARLRAPGFYRGVWTGLGRGLQVDGQPGPAAPSATGLDPDDPAARPVLVR